MKYLSQFAPLIALAAASLCVDSHRTFAQSSDSNPLISEGQILIHGKQSPYLIRRLPVSAFPELPATIQAQLTLRGCMIPQTYLAHRPENVVHASLESLGSSDWAVLCSVKGAVSLLVFFASAIDASEPVVLASAPETDRLEAHGANNVLGFNWGIDAVTPTQVHEAQAGLMPRPALIDHDALADETIDQRTVYHFYANGAWRLLEMPVP